MLGSRASASAFQQAIFVLLTILFSFTVLSARADEVRQTPMEIAQEYARKKQPEQALIWYQVAAKEGNTRALFLVGVAEVKGVGLEKNPAAGVRKIALAAAGGLDAAQFALGYFYQKGVLGAPEPEKAYQWYRAAAEQGLAIAQVALGALYVKGSGVEQSLSEGEVWFEKAWAQQHPMGGFNLGLLKLRRADSPDGFLDGMAILEATAEGGHLRSQLALSKLYLEGRKPYLAAASDKGVFWLQKAAGQGSALAQLGLGLIYLKGSLLPTNAELAYYWLNKAAMQGDARAQLGLAGALITGKVLPKNLPEAYVWLLLSARSGNPQALALRDRLATALSELQREEGERKAQALAIQITGKPPERALESPEQVLGETEQGLSI